MRHKILVSRVGKLLGALSLDVALRFAAGLTCIVSHDNTGPQSLIKLFSVFLSRTSNWREQKNAPRPELLSHLLELWNVRSPEINDVPNTGYELFAAPHLWHVAQGQGMLNKDVAEIQLQDYKSIHRVREFSTKFTESLLKERLIDHAEALARTKNC